jgi:hypothetical protein
VKPDHLRLARCMDSLGLGRPRKPLSRIRYSLRFGIDPRRSAITVSMIVLYNCPNPDSPASCKNSKPALSMSAAVIVATRRIAPHLGHLNG